MKKILSFLFMITLSLFLVGCEESSPTPYNYNADEAQAKLKELGKTSGFLIEYSYTSDVPTTSPSTDEYSDISSMVLKIGVKDDITYMSAYGKEVYYDFSDSLSVTIYTGTYNKFLNDYKWEKEKIKYTEYMGREDYETYDAIFDYLVPFDNEDLLPTSVSSGMVAGRSCDKLTIKSPNGDYDSVNTKVTLYIDKELGICLKMTMEYSAYGETHGTTLEYTRFDTSVNLTLPIA